MNELRLRTFVNTDTSVIASWCKDEEIFYKWSAGLFGSYPLSQETFINFFKEWCQKECYFPFVAFDDNGPQGFFIMRVPGEDNRKVRFGFIILNPEIRGKGYGKKMLALGKKFAREIYGATEVSLGVFENNPKAMYCYKASGFTETGDVEEYSINGFTWKCIEMKCSLQDKSE